MGRGGAEREESQGEEISTERKKPRAGVCGDANYVERGVFRKCDVHHCACTQAGMNINCMLVRARERGNVSFYWVKFSLKTTRTDRRTHTKIDPKISIKDTHQKSRYL